jgi:hypothetical protein
MNQIEPEFLLAVLIEIPADAASIVLAYEDAVLPLLTRDGGYLQRRLRAVDGSAELHIISFQTPEGPQAFATDPSRLQLQRLLQGRVLRQRVLQVEQIT